MYLIVSFLTVAVNKYILARHYLTTVYSSSSKHKILLFRNAFVSLKKKPKHLAAQV